MFVFVMLLFATYKFGYSLGFKEGQKDIEAYYNDYFEELASNNQLPDQIPEIVVISTTPAPAQKASLIRDVDWGGPDLWEAVNERRQQLGVNSLDTREELCTIASIRLNELLDLGKLDGHEGFSSFQERREDLSWIFEKYSNIAEFLAAGGSTPQETVSLWENTLGHKQLLTGGQFVWGCVYSQNSFAVAIAAY
jgi:hypothetical protein